MYQPPRLYDSLLRLSFATTLSLVNIAHASQELSGSKSVIMGSRQHVRDIKSGSPLPYKDDIRAYKKEYAEALDAQDPLRSFRDEFIIPSKNDLKRKTLAVDDSAYQDLLHAQAAALTFGFLLSH